MINLRSEADDYHRAQRRHDDCGAEADDAISEEDYEDDASHQAHDDNYDEACLRRK